MNERAVDREFACGSKMVAFREPLHRDEARAGPGPRIGARGLPVVDLGAIPLEMTRQSAGWIVLVFAAALAAMGCRRALPDLGGVGSFALVDQGKIPMSDQSLRGQVWVAAFMFTRCPTVCPQMMEAMRQIQSAADKRGIEMRLVTISVDPEYDTPEVLTAFAEKQGADLGTWSFLTGEPTRVESLAHGFRIALEGTADAGRDHYAILHGSHGVLVDRKLRIRGYYRIREPAEQERLLVDVRTLQ